MDKEALAKQIRIISQNAWSTGTNLTVNSMVEHIVRETLNYVFDELEPSMWGEVDLTSLNNRIAALEEQMKFINAVMSYTQWKEQVNGSTNEGNQNAQRGPKTKRIAA